MRSVTSNILKIAVAVALIGATFIAIVHFATPDLAAFAAATRTAVADVAEAPTAVAPVAQTDNSSAGACGNFNPHDINGLKNCLIWVRANFTNSEIRQAMLDAYMYICAERPGGVPPSKPGNPPPQLPAQPQPPAQPTPCDVCGAGQPGGDAP